MPKSTLNPQPSTLNRLTGLAFLLLLCAFNLAAQPRLGVNTDTNGVLLGHTNFFGANSNRLLAVVQSLTNELASTNYVWTAIQTATNGLTGGGGGGGGTSYTFSNTNLAVELGAITNGTGVAFATNNSHLARVTALNLVSNQNINFLPQRDNATLANALGIGTADYANRQLMLPTNALHGFLYFPANGTTRTTNYLLGISRVSTNGVIHRADADRLTNLLSADLPATGFDYPSALVRVGDFAYFNVGISNDQRQGIVRWNPLTMAYSTICTNTNSASIDGSLATDGTNLFLTGNGTSGYVAKYDTNGALQWETNTWGGSVGGPPHAGKKLHNALWDGQWVWSGTFRLWSGLVRVDPATGGFTRYDFDTNHFAFTNFYATDDIIDSRRYIWTPGESANGFVARTDKETGITVPIFTGVYASCYGAFNDGRNIWFTYPADTNSIGTNDGVIVRLDPETHVIDQFAAPKWINELAFDESGTMYGGTFGIGTNSYFLKSPLGEHLLTAYCNTNAAWDFAFDRSRGKFFVGGVWLSNTPSYTPSASIVTNQDQRTDLKLAGSAFSAVINTNTLFGAGAGTTVANVQYNLSPTGNSWTNVSAGRFYTNNGNGTFSYWSGGVERYVTTNSSVASTNWFVVGGSAPAPITRHPADVQIMGTLSMSNILSGAAPAPFYADGTNCITGTLTNTPSGTLQGYIAQSNLFYTSFFKTNLNPFALEWEGAARGQELLLTNAGRLTVAGPTASANIAGVVISNGVVSGITRPVRGIYNTGITAGSTNYMAFQGQVTTINGTPTWVTVNFVNRTTTLTNLAMFWNSAPNNSQFFRVTIFTNSIANIGTGVATDLSVLITNSSLVVYAINPSNSVVVPSNCWYSAQIITSSGAASGRPSLYVEEMQ